MGKSLSQENAAKVASNFHIVLTAFDNDRSGREATEKISAQLFGSKALDSTVCFVGGMVIPEGKDLGEMNQDLAARLLQDTIRKAKRQL
jgi:predicted nuclease with TOPRIM domain